MKDMIEKLKAIQARLSDAALAEVIAELERRQALVDRVDAAQDSVKPL